MVKKKTYRVKILKKKYKRERFGRSTYTSCLDETFDCVRFELIFRTRVSNDRLGEVNPWDVSLHLRSSRTKTGRIGRESDRMLPKNPKRGRSRKSSAARCEVNPRTFGSKGGIILRVVSLQKLCTVVATRNWSQARGREHERS